MKRKSLLGVVCLAIGLLLTTQLTSARYELKVNEAETRFSFGELAPEVFLVIEDGSAQPIAAVVRVELLVPDNAVKTSAERQVSLKSGKQKVPFTTTKTSLRYVAPVAVAKQQLFTPRLREYFPETLLWNPELTTDKKGRAQLDFKLADNITTWKMSVIGSTADGELGTAETEIRSFQPFFADLDPPRVLTEGDRISLPVVLRNYLERKQSVGLDLQPAKWFSILDSNHKQVEVPAGDSVNQTFALQAIASVKDGKQRGTAIGSDSSDAIEKLVTVHPDGEEKAETTSDLLQTTSSLNVTLPPEVIANSAQVQLKVYPNLLTHVRESVAGGLLSLTTRWRLEFQFHVSSAFRSDREIVCLAYLRLLQPRSQSTSYTGNFRRQVSV